MVHIISGSLMSPHKPQSLSLIHISVDLVERMKVCTCLNPLHTAMAVFGCLLGYTSIAAEMKDESIVRLIKRIGYVEGLSLIHI